MTLRRSASASSSPLPGIEGRQLLNGMAQEVGLACGPSRARLPGGPASWPPGVPHTSRRRRHGLTASRQPAEGVEDVAVGRRIDQRAVVVLAVDLDERRADRSQHLHADRLVVDEGARAPVRELDAAQDQVAVDVDIGPWRDRGGPGWPAGRSNTAVTWPACSPCRTRRAVAAPAEREREGIEQDGLAGARLAREHAEPGRKSKLQPVDQDDVADRSCTACGSEA